jgi:hypothetical protein
MGSLPRQGIYTMILRNFRLLRLKTGRFVLVPRHQPLTVELLP